MSTLVLRCGDVPVPIALASLELITTQSIPTMEEIDQFTPLLDATTQPRLIVLGSDGALAAVLTGFMRSERLHVEIGYVPTDKSPASRIYKTGTGSAAATKVLEGKATPMPLIRDDTGTVLVGAAVIAGQGGSTLEGEAYVDDDRMFSGVAAAVHVAPTAGLPGLRSYVDRGRTLRTKRWLSGRAMQLGTPGAIVTRDGVRSHRVVTRSTFYRHSDEWLLVV